jgi:type II secretory pathway pseudopilin PulG
MSSRATAAVVCSIVLLAAPAGLVSAQSWSDEQLAVWSVIQAQWKAAADKDEGWPNRFLHDSFLGWSAENPAPRDKASTARWTKYGDENSTTLMTELAPLGIVVEGNTAVAHYVYSTATEDREGERETTHGRYTDILVRDGGSWRFLAWQGGETPEDD